MNLTIQGPGTALTSAKIYPVDRRRMQIGALASGLNHPEQIHILFDLMRLRVTEARAAGLITAPEGELADVELFAYLVLYDAGLLTREELAHTEWAARMGGADGFRQRLPALVDLLAANRAGARGAASE